MTEESKSIDETIPPPIGETNQPSVDKATPPRILQLGGLGGPRDPDRKYFWGKDEEEDAKTRKGIAEYLRKNCRDNPQEAEEIIKQNNLE